MDRSNCYPNNSAMNRMKSLNYLSCLNCPNYVFYHAIIILLKLPI